MKHTLRNTLALALGGMAVTGFLVVKTVALAAEPDTTWKNGGHGAAGWAERTHGIYGTVSAANGSTLTVTSMGFGPNAAQTTYTVNAANAAVMKDGAASTLSAIAVGDRVIVQGTVTGTTVAATAIRDGVPQRLRDGTGPADWHVTPLVAGDGQPIIGGSVTAVSGTTLTVTNQSNVTYTVDAANATVTKGNAASTLSGVSVGDNVIVQGTVNGTSVTASSVQDQGTTPSGEITSSTVAHGKQGEQSGFFGAIFGFFQHLFGF